jgi:D-amino-acid oxidase
MASHPPIFILGCGVSGLSSGIRLLEGGFEVTIVARDLPPNTTSNVAAAIWYPYNAFPQERVLAWGRVTLDEFYRLMDAPETGLSAVTLLEVFGQPTPDPWWRDVPRQFSRMAEPPPGYQDGYVVEVPLIETPKYMRYLMERFEGAGGRIEQRAVSTLAELIGDNRLVVNCAGLGAREVAGDEALYPIRGQIIRVKRPADVRCWLGGEESSELLYIIPRSEDCILGGTGQEGDWTLDADPETAEAILQRCAALEPALKDAEIIEHRVGLRPGRREVRLEMEQVRENCAVIHNYGHGGAGFTLSWGCADEVAELAAQFAQQVDRSPASGR